MLSKYGMDLYQNQSNEKKSSLGGGEIYVRVVVREKK